MALLGYSLLVLCLSHFLWLLATRYRKSLRDIPGPWIASFSNAWKLAAIYCSDMPGWTIEAHRTYGKVVRIGPNHVSFASPKAFHTIYATNNLFVKSDFYEVGAPPYKSKPLENLFSLRDTQQHATLRRNIGGLYTKIAVLDFEPHVDRCVELFLNQVAKQTTNGSETLNMSLWLHFFAFDCLGDINISKKFGMLESGHDVKGFISSSDRIFFLVGLLTQAPLLQRLLKGFRFVAPVENAEPILKLTLDEVSNRRKSSQRENDMLCQFLNLHSTQPEKVSITDITAAIFINLTAGHDVLAITLRAVWHYLAQNGHVLKALRAEIEAAAKDTPISSTVPITKISKLPYLNAVIQETLRVHPNTGTIIERKVPSGGVLIDGYHMPPNTIVGVNAWVLHRNRKIYGEDAEAFRPERWIEASDAQLLEMNRCLFSFGAGAHTCIGKNIAMLIINKVVVEFYRRYDARLIFNSDGQAWKIHGGWVTKQTQMNMQVSRL
ncbi:cytochrome P450 oxidoreductase [Xylariaceae sp. AK1471]|nr:cytochrome P450 oxidoreductase [Xylariaceae sp. AK1471]